jgi:hypothetical protein
VNLGATLGSKAIRTVSMPEFHTVLTPVCPPVTIPVLSGFRLH